jgi:hypothetical protein
LRRAIIFLEFYFVPIQTILYKLGFDFVQLKPMQRVGRPAQQHVLPDFILLCLGAAFWLTEDDLTDWRLIAV